MNRNERSGSAISVRGSVLPNARGVLLSVVLFTAAGSVFPQSNGDEDRTATRSGAAAAPAAELQDRFDRFLFAPDAEAAILAETLIHEPPAILARLAVRPPTETRRTAIVRVDGSDPPLACVVVLPTAPPPPNGYPTYFVFAGPMFGPEEFVLRSRMSAVLSAGFAVLSPVEPTIWLRAPVPSATVEGRDSWRLAALAAGAERILPLDPSRRILMIGFPPSRAQDMVFDHAGSAFAAVHRVLPGDGEQFREDRWLDQGPRRFVFHCGPRRGETAARAIRRLTLAATAIGAEVLSPLDPLIEHAPTARFGGSAAVLAARDLAPNRPPTSAARVAAATTGPSGGAGIICGVSSGRGSVAIDGFASDQPSIRALSLESDEPLQLELPIGGPAVDWTRPEAWTASERRNQPLFAACDGRLLPPDRAREKLFAFRLSLLSGVPFQDAMRVRIQRRP